MGRHFGWHYSYKSNRSLLLRGFHENQFKCFQVGVGLLAAAGLPVPAFAQVIVYGPAATSVPTLSQWGMLILAVLLAMAAVSRRASRATGCFRGCWQ
jgi:hypothetical protein